MYEVIARGVLIANGSVLLCRHKGRKTSYLPGGHIDPGEQARAALVRELHEEMGLEVTANEFLGCCEHAFFQDGRLHTEVNLIFAMHCKALESRPETLHSQENWLEFFWQDCASLKEATLLPDVLVEWLADGMPKSPMFLTSGDAWSRQHPGGVQ